jgi:16S rRNA (guanine966-N2)-methyltransferase
MEIKIMHSKKPNHVRIIGGRFRGRRISFLDLPTLRPTPHRVRETLFNWLAPMMPGAYCLDLFSGSGALGIEALSRGAEHVTFVDSNSHIVDHIKKQLVLLEVDYAANVLCATLPAILPAPKKPYNIVFLDPPFHQNMIANISHWLDQQAWLANVVFIYFEVESNLSPLPIPATWKTLKHKIAGKVGYHLLQKELSV